jgi:hypothetical protein
MHWSSHPRSSDVCRAIVAVLVAAVSLSSLAVADVAAAELPAVSPSSLIQWG